MNKFLILSALAFATQAQTATYAGECLSNLDGTYGIEVDATESELGVYASGAVVELYAVDTDGDSVYCYHNALHGFIYTGTADSADDDFDTDFTVTAWDLDEDDSGDCTEDTSAPVDDNGDTEAGTTLSADTIYYTTTDTAGIVGDACGYYVEYSWAGSNGAATVTILSLDAQMTAASSFLLVALASFLY